MNNEQQYMVHPFSPFGGRGACTMRHPVETRHATSLHAGGWGSCKGVACNAPTGNHAAWACRAPPSVVLCEPPCNSV
jgi:hypothetical protein